MDQLFVFVRVIIFLWWVVSYFIDDVAEKFEDPSANGLMVALLIHIFLDDDLS